MTRLKYEYLAIYEILIIKTPNNSLVIIVIKPNNFEPDSSFGRFMREINCTLYLFVI